MGVGSQFVQISGSRVLLTGASGGIGRAIARELAAREASLVLSGRRLDALEALAAETGARALRADLAERGELEGLLGQAGEIDILVANAALPASGALDSFSVAEIDRALDVNLRAPIVLARGLAPAMARRGRGHLLFMSSVAGKVPTAGAAIYAASKAGLGAFATALRAELHGSGVGVSCVFPGFIRDAGMFADTGVALPAGLGTRTPEQVAQAVAVAIERNRGELDVAPLSLRAGNALARLAPDVAAGLARRLGSERLTRDIVAGQREKR